jgi:uncharacterized protein YkwD
MATKKKPAKRKKPLEQKKAADPFYTRLLLVVIIGFMVITGLYNNSLRSDNLQLNNTNETQNKAIEDYREETEKLREETEKLREETEKLKEEVKELSFSPKNLLKLTNAEREKEGVRVLTLNTLLNESARLKALDMKENNYWSHDSPQGVEPWVFFDKVGYYDYYKAGENLANGFNEPHNAEAMVAAWMKSPAHRENMLDSTYREVGFSTILEPAFNKSPIALKNGQLTVAHYGSR